MKASAIIFVFGDLTDDARAYLRQLIRTKPDPILDSFLSASYHAVRTDLLALSQVGGGQDWRFSNLLELPEVTPSGPQKVALDHALTVISHFGLFFEWCQQSNGVYPDLRSTHFSGLCVGSLPVAAIRCCRSLSELLPIAVRVCVLGFRAGRLAADVAARFDCNPDPSHVSWVMTVPDLKVDDANLLIDRFTNDKVPYSLKKLIKLRSPP
jgi:hypothetical protein